MLVFAFFTMLVLSLHFISNLTSELPPLLLLSQCLPWRMGLPGKCYSLELYLRWAGPRHRGGGWKGAAGVAQGVGALLGVWRVVVAGDLVAGAGAGAGREAGAGGGGVHSLKRPAVELWRRMEDPILPQSPLLETLPKLKRQRTPSAATPAG